MPRLPTSDYAVFWRQNGMRTPPRMATGRALGMEIPGMDEGVCNMACTAEQA